MTAEKISNRQLLFILIMIRTTIIISFMPVITSHDALQDAWAAAIISFFGAAFLVIIIAGLSIRFPDKTLIQYSEMLLGKWVGRGICLIILAAFLFMAATDVRLYGEMLVGGFLPDTPMIFIISAMTLVVLLAAYAGIETIGRAADLLFPVFILMIGASLLFPLSGIEDFLGNLEPVLARGAKPVLGAALIPTLVISQYLALTILTPSTTEPRKTLLTALQALGYSSVILTVSAIIVVSTVGAHRAARSVFPFLLMVRSIQVTEFIERIEVMVVFAWGFGQFLGMALYLYCGARGLSQVIGIADYRVLLGPMAVIMIFFSINAYRNIFQLRDFFTPETAGTFIGIGWFLIPFTLLWLGYLYRRLKYGTNNEH